MTYTTKELSTLEDFASSYEKSYLWLTSSPSSFETLVNTLGSPPEYPTDTATGVSEAIKKYKTVVRIMGQLVSVRIISPSFFFHLVSSCIVLYPIISPFLNLFIY
jgi:hypothetical protein